MERRGLSWRALAVLLALLYVTAIGGTRAGTYHFPLVAFSHLLSFTTIAYWLACSTRQGIWLPKTPLDAPILAFYLLCVVSTVLSTDVRLSVENLAHLTILVALYYMVVYLLKSGWKVSDFVTPMLVVAAVVVIAEILELALWLGIWWAGTGEFSPLLALGDYRRRLVMGPSNVLAWYLVLLMPLILARLLESRSLRGQIHMGILGVAAGIVLASTLSRSGMIGMAVSVAIFTLLAITPRIANGAGSLRAYLRHKRVMASLLAAACVTAASAMFAFYLVSSRLYTVSIRFELWRAASAIIAARPLTGGGPGTFGYLLHQVADPDPYGPDVYYNNAHNGFLNIAAETGIPSLAAGLWLIAALAAAAWRHLSHLGKKHPGGGMVVAACMAGILGLMASMFFDVPWVFPLTTIHVIVLAAITVAPLSSPREAVGRPLRCAGVALVVLAMAMLGWSDVGHALQQRAVDSMHANRPVNAVAALSSASAWDPFLSIYRFQLGMAQGRLSSERKDQALLNQAVQQYEEEMARGGDTPINNGNLSWLEWQAGRPADAVERMERAVSQAPRDSRYRVGLGYLLEATGDCKGAEGEYIQAIRYSPSLIGSGLWQASDCRSAFKSGIAAREDVTALTRAWAAYFAGDFAAAARLVEDAQQSGAALVLRGQVEVALGEYAAAEKHLTEALATSPSSQEARIARGQLYLAMGDRQRATHDLAIASLLGSGRADLLLGELAYQRGNLEKAIALFRGSVPGCVAPGATYDYASHVYHRSDLKVDFWPQSITCTPRDDSVPYYLHLATAYRSLDRADEAEEVCGWLADFYKGSYLNELASEEAVRDACTQTTGAGRPRGESSSGLPERGAPT